MNSPPRQIEIPTQQIEFRKCEIFGTDHDRYKEIAKRCWHGRHQKEKDHDDAVHRKELVVGVGGNEVWLGSQQLQSNHPGEKTAQEEEERDRDEVEDAYALVIARKQPTHQAVLIVEIGALRQGSRLLIRKGNDSADGSHGISSATK